MRMGGNEFRVDRDMVVGAFTDLVRQMSGKRIRRLAEHLRNRELSLNQYSILNIVHYEEGCSSIQLANRLQLKAASITYLVDSLEKRGLVARVENPDDRRSHTIHLTEEGLKLVGVPENHAEMLGVFEQLSQDELEMLYLAMRLIRNKCLGDEQER